MELYLVRHAHALPLAGPGEDGPTTDADRPLSEHGRALFTAAVRALGAMGVRFARIEHSPLLRAAQTAELCGPLCAGERVANPALAAAPTAELCESIDVDRTALVGHEPHLSDLVALLCSDAPRAAASMRFAKGAVARLEGDPVPGGMRLSALWPPKPLAALGGGPREGVESR